MTAATVIGGILVVLGLMFLVRGLGGLFGFFAVGAAPIDLDPVSRLLEAIAGFVSALTKAPTWLASAVIGLILTVLGCWVGGWLPSL